MSTQAHGCNLRKGRLSLDGQIYLITAVTHQRYPYFRVLAAGRILVREMMRSDAFGCSKTMAFVVMPDHLHWLFSLENAASLSSLVGNLKLNSARKVNDLIARRGHPVWQRGFHDHALHGEAAIIEAARYIIANPLRAGLARRVGDYPLWDAAWL
ncbi:MAG: transposase [Gammaproteobacteria bacterium]